MQNDENLARFVIERDIPGAGRLTEQELREISRKSCKVLDELGSSIRWIHSYVTDDRIYCIYDAADPSLLRKHAAMGNFPADRISRVGTIIDPSTAED